MTQVQVRVGWLGADGRGGAVLADGRSVRIAGAVPGDEVVAEVVGEGTRAEGVIVGWITRSPDRRPAPCPHSAACGGCDLDGFEPAARAAALRDGLARTFQVPADAVGWIAGAGESGWRARIKLTIDGAELGYRAPRSHTLVPIDVCAIARPEIVALHERIAAWLRADPRRGDGLAAVELRAGGGRAVAAFQSADRGSVSAGVRSALAELGDVALDGRRAHGDPTLTISVAGRALRASPSAFFQVNPEVNDALVAAVCDAVRSRGAERVLDLYAGIGNFGVPLAASGAPVVAVEAPGAAIEDLRHNARGLPVEVLAVRAERFEPSRTPFDAAILDPPRSGAPGVFERVVRNRPRTVVYVSCVPRNAARDLARVRGYRVAAVHGVDLFPQTHHVEAVVVLERV